MKEYIVSIEDNEPNTAEIFVGQIRQHEEVIRCGECEYHGNPLMCPLYRISPPPNGYCYCAERRKEQ